MKPLPGATTATITPAQLAQFDLIAKAIFAAIRPEIDAIAARVTHLELEVRALRSRAGTQPSPTPRRDVPRKGSIIFR